MRGFERRIGILKDRLHLPAQRLHSADDAARDIDASHADRAASRLHQPQDHARQRVLPDPDSPTRPSVSPGSMRQATHPSTTVFIASESRACADSSSRPHRLQPAPCFDGKRLSCVHYPSFGCSLWNPVAS